MTHTDSSDTQLLSEAKYLLALEGLCEYSSESALFRQYPNPQMAIQKALLDSFTGFNPEQFQQRLAEENMTLEGPWQWEKGSAKPMEMLNTLTRLAPEDEKVTTVFMQCLQQRRKSSKYLQQMQTVFEKYPTENSLFDLIMTYLLRWDIAAAESFFEAHVHKLSNPILGRFASAAATFWSLDSDEDLTPAREALFERIMKHQFQLTGHIDRIPTFEEALNFYKATVFWWGLKKELPRFVFALNQLFYLEQEQAALMFLLARDQFQQKQGLKETLGQNYMAATRRLLQWFFYTLLDDLKGVRELKAFMQPLWKRNTRWESFA